MICPPGKSMSFHKKETEKIELVARPEVGDAHPTKLTLVSVNPPVDRVDMHGQGALADAL